MSLDESLTAREMKAVEMNSEYLGVSKLQLMENAGKVVASLIVERYKKKSKVSIVCGPGGNGGDGFATARHLASSGFKPEVLILGNPEKNTSSPAYSNFRSIQQMKKSIDISYIRDSSEIKSFKSDVIIDAIFGTGIRGVLKAPYYEMVNEINASDAFIISIDNPTGVDVDTGEVLGNVVKADCIIVLHKKKKFLQNNQFNKNFIESSIGIPPEAELFTGPGDVYLSSRQRSLESHKGDHGSLLVIGGSETYSGAPALASLSAYSTGVDLVYVATPESISDIVAGFSPSLITLKLKGSRLNVKNAQSIISFLDKINAVVIGPGLGLHPDTQNAVLEIIENLEKRKITVLIDADALKCYPNKRKISTEAIFTPHLKEFEILTKKIPKGTLEEKSSIVKKEASHLDGTILLKGNIDIISDGSKIRYNHTGNPGMTVGGTGDVLSGIAGAFLAQNISPFQSSTAASFINGMAGDFVAHEKGHHLKPEDIIEVIPNVIEDAINERLRAYVR
jgi:NAD(P)H-hydrate epimerase